LSGRTIVADAFVVVTGRSKIQTRSIADAVVDAAKAAGYTVARTEGYADAGWILIDLGAVVVHVSPRTALVLQPRAPVGAPEARRASSS